MGPRHCGGHRSCDLHGAVLRQHGQGGERHGERHDHLLRHHRRCGCGRRGQRRCRHRHGRRDGRRHHHGSRRDVLPAGRRLQRFGRSRRRGVPRRDGGGGDHGLCGEEDHRELRRARQLHGHPRRRGRRRRCGEGGRPRGPFQQRGHCARGQHGQAGRPRHHRSHPRGHRHRERHRRFGDVRRFAQGGGGRVGRRRNPGLPPAGGCVCGTAIRGRDARRRVLRDGAGFLRNGGRDGVQVPRNRVRRLQPLRLHAPLRRNRQPRRRHRHDGLCDAGGSVRGGRGR